MSFKKMTADERYEMEIPQFRDLDYFAVDKYLLPIDLMMENAGLQLANTIVKHSDRGSKILIGVGNGNNGGGGLVAARRLSAWGYQVYLDIWGEINKELPKKQLERALAFGAQAWQNEKVNVWVDAYLGFSQRLPLPDYLTRRILLAKETNCLRISLDIPVGFSQNGTSEHFEPDIILTLAAPKRELKSLVKSRLYVADLGIPSVAYKEFDRSMLPFEQSNIFQINRPVYKHHHSAKMLEIHARTLGILKEGSMVKYLKSYAGDLREGFLAKIDEVAVQLSNSYKPLVGSSIKEIFRFDLSNKDFHNAAAAIHGFEAVDSVKDVKLDGNFETAVDVLLAGDYFGLKEILEARPQLTKQHSQFGHKAQLIHYCASNAVEMYRQVVPDNLSEMIQLLLDFGADPSVKIPVYDGEFDFFTLFSTSAHPKDAGVVKKVEKLFK